MHRRIIPIACVIALLALLPFVAAQDAAAATTEASTAQQNTECAALKKLSIQNTTITTAELVAKGKTDLPIPGVAGSTNDPAFCRVAGYMTPTEDSHIAFEVWMPSSWNGRYQQIGNGGYAGGIPYSWMLPQLRRNYVVAGTDDGHKSPGIDTAWAKGHPQKVIDYSFRAVHLLSLTAREIVHSYYSKKAAYSYFNGCSDGGREALMEAQRYPDDFDGILSGNPAINFTHLAISFIWNEQALLDKPESYIPPKKLAVIQSASLAACDALDGVKDGLLEDPTACHFDPSVLLCKGADGPNCLTAAQVQTVKRFYSGPRNPRTGKTIFPGLAPGNEGEGPNWFFWLTRGDRSHINGGQFPLGNAFFKGFIFGDPHWDFRDLNFDQDVKLTDAKMAGILNATDPDLKPFKKHGSKLIQYHGWDDSAIAPLSSVHYYQSVEDAMGGAENTRDFYRLYMVPGMGHCWGGPGPNNFGGLIQPAPDPIQPDGDIFGALTQWVEHRKTPERIIATKYKDDNPTKAIEMTRPICPYPEHAKWTGSGSTKDAANFVCK